MSYICHSGRNRYGCQTRAAFKGTIFDVRHDRRERYACQTAATGKRPFPNTCHTIRDCYACQTAAFSKHTIPYACQARWNRHFAQTAAFSEHIITYVRHAVWNLGTLQFTTKRKRKSPYGRHTIRNRDSFQSKTFIKRILFYAFHTTPNCYVCYIGVPFKHTPFYALYRIVFIHFNFYAEYFFRILIWPSQTLPVRHPGSRLDRQLSSLIKRPALAPILKLVLRVACSVRNIILPLCPCVFICIHTSRRNLYALRVIRHEFTAFKMRWPLSRCSKRRRFVSLHGYGFQTAAALKCPDPYVLHPGRNGNLAQITAVFKQAFCNVCHAVWKRYPAQPYAAIECILSYALHTVRNREYCQTVASRERPFLYGFHAFRNGYAFHIRALS